VAVGYSILVIFYHMVKTGESYQEKGVNSFLTADKHKIQQRLVRQLERLGSIVILQLKAETASA
jgi:transposase